MELLIKFRKRKHKVPRLRRIAEKNGNSASLGMTEMSLIRDSLALHGFPGAGDNLDLRLLRAQARVGRF